jgi:threonine aldolase
MREADFRSDTKTRPNAAMRKAMAEAEVGDDVAGEDPTVNRLEAMAAERLGKEAAVYVTSGTQGNLVALLTHCQRGDEVILGDKSHIVKGEGGGPMVLGGVVISTLPIDERGMLDPDEVDAAVHADGANYPRTTLVALENTHNAAGGVPLTPEDMKSVADVAHGYDIPVHVDGARLFNASVALETPAAELVRDVDTVTFAPVGSLLCGSNEFIHEARRWRKMLGSAMRQSGVIAAAGIVALETMVDRLAEDHSNARRLATGLAEIPGIAIDPEAMPTNLVFFTLKYSNHDEIARRINEQGVLLGARGGGYCRMATHADVTGDDVEFALDVISTTIRDYGKK